MNFGAVEQANGNLITMFGVFTEIGGATTTQNGKVKSLCKVRDDANVEHKVHIYQGKGRLPAPQQLNQRCQFNLSTFQGNYQGQAYTGYSGFWNSTAQVAQGQPQNAQQGTSQQPKASVNTVVGDVKELCIAKMNALNRAVEISLAKANYDIPAILQQADNFVEYIYSPRVNGNSGSEETRNDYDYAPIDQGDIPF